MLREELILGLYVVVFDKTSRPEIFSKETMMGLFGWVIGSILLKNNSSFGSSQEAINPEFSSPNIKRLWSSITSLLMLLFTLPFGITPVRVGTRAATRVIPKDPT
jgi:hypothetical protein